jgi:hypothetical protein
MLFWAFSLWLGQAMAMPQAAHVGKGVCTTPGQFICASTTSFAICDNNLQGFIQPLAQGDGRCASFAGGVTSTAVMISSSTTAASVTTSAAPTITNDTDKNWEVAVLVGKATTPARTTPTPASNYAVWPSSIPAWATAPTATHTVVAPTGTNTNKDKPNGPGVPTAIPTMIVMYKDGVEEVVGEYSRFLKYPSCSDFVGCMSEITWYTSQQNWYGLLKHWWHLDE